MSNTIRKYWVLAFVLAAGIFLGLYFRGPRPADTSSLVEPGTECSNDLSAQAAYLERESYSRDITFAGYPAHPTHDLRPAPLDVNSSPYAREFKTRLGGELSSRGINFAGYYSVVRVGMTGWGMNYWIVDRRTGRAHEFPFHATFLDFDAKSTLIIVNPKDSIRGLLNQENGGGCFFLNQEKVSDLKPFYLQWKNDTLSLLAPPDRTPPVNTFWIDYLSGIPDSAPSPVAFFVRETRKGVIQTLKRVPHEGYNGFMLIEAFPGLDPADFAGISTRNGDYGVHQGKLQFTGNASLDAPAMTPEGMALLLRSIALRRSLPFATEADVTALVSVISRRRRGT